CQDLVCFDSLEGINRGYCADEMENITDGDAMQYSRSTSQMMLRNEILWIVKWLVSALLETKVPLEESHCYKWKKGEGTKLEGSDHAMVFMIFVLHIADDAKKSNLTKDLGGCVTSDGTVSTQEDNSKDGPEFTALPDEVLGKLTRQTQKKMEIETNNKREMKLQRMMI
ncbi:hypothetical protein Tco_1167553, partial [Tanacetum coccineum]